MQKWLFTSGMTRGSFTAVENDGERRQVVGIDLVLGISEGENVKIALQKLISKLKLNNGIPEYLYDDKKVVAYSFQTSEWVQVGKIEIIEDDQPIKESKFETKICKWCDNELPSNGGAQFAHLQKHLRQLLKNNKITIEQMQSVRNINLTQEFDIIFSAAKKENAFK